MKKYYFLTLLLCCTASFAVGQDFPRLLDGYSFQTEVFVNQLQGKKGGILVRVNRPGEKDYILGVIETERSTRYYAFSDRVYFLKGLGRSNGNYPLWVCDGNKGRFEYISDVTASFLITSDESLIIYDDSPKVFPIPNITIKNIKGETVKTLKGVELLASAKELFSIKRDTFKVNMIEDNKNNRVLFSYEDTFSGEIVLPTLQVRLFKLEEHENTLKKYFPYAGS
jgi:hypothetical protein